MLRSACASARVLDVYGGKTEDMTNVQSYTFNGTTAQMFSINKVEKPSDAFDAPTEDTSVEETTTEAQSQAEDKDLSSDFTNIFKDFCDGFLKF